MENKDNYKIVLFSCNEKVGDDLYPFWINKDILVRPTCVERKTKENIE
jgi:hypothetical protein